MQTKVRNYSLRHPQILARLYCECQWFFLNKNFLLQLSGAAPAVGVTRKRKVPAMSLSPLRVDVDLLKPEEPNH